MQSFSDTVRGIDSPSQLALGMTIGAMIGFLPLDNLLFIGLLVLLVLSGANLLTGISAGIGAAILAPLVEPVFHSVGHWILNLEVAQTMLSKFFQFPAAAWTRLDNTIVAGSFAVTVFASLPFYLVSLSLFERYRDYIHRLWTRGRLVNWILGYTTNETEQV